MACFLSESDGDDLLLDRLCREEMAEHEELGLLYASRSDNSEEESIEEEVEEMAMECEDSRRLIEYLSMNPRVSLYELANLRTAPSATKHHTQKSVFARQSKPVVVATGDDRITDEDRKRRAIRITVGDDYIDVMFENYVFVSYFCNRHTGDKFRLSLCELATKLLPYGVGYGKNRFTKVTLRYLLGPSHYFFGSGVKVESGTYSETIAFKTHHNSMRMLKETCGYDSIAVRKRKCQNIVAKGTLERGICLLLLKHKYPNYVEYSTDFAGAIIRVNKIDADQCDAPSSRRGRRRRRRDDDDEDEDASSSYDDDDDDDDEEEDDDSSSSYEYDEENPYEKKTCHEDFDYNMVDEEVRKRNEALLMANEAKCEYRVMDKKPVKQKDLLTLAVAHNPDDLNDYQVKALTQKKNVTVLAFLKGRVICAGTKSNKEALKTFAKVMPMLASCADTEQNRAAEAELVRLMTTRDGFIIDSSL